MCSRLGISPATSLRPSAQVSSTKATRRVVADQHHLAGCSRGVRATRMKPPTASAAPTSEYAPSSWREQRDVLAGLNPARANALAIRWTRLPSSPVGRAPFAVEHRQPGCVEAVAALHERPEADVLDGAGRSIRPPPRSACGENRDHGCCRIGVEKPPASASATRRPRLAGRRRDRGAGRRARPVEHSRLRLPGVPCSEAHRCVHGTGTTEHGRARGEQRRAFPVAAQGEFLVGDQLGRG